MGRDALEFFLLIGAACMAVVIALLVLGWGIHKLEGDKPKAEIRYVITECTQEGRVDF